MRQTNKYVSGCKLKSKQKRKHANTRFYVENPKRKKTTVAEDGENKCTMNFFELDTRFLSYTGC